MQPARAETDDAAARDLLLALVAVHGEKNLLEQSGDDAGIFGGANHAVRLACRRG